MVPTAIWIVHSYDGDKLFTIVDGRRAMTPMLLVMVGIGGTDILFALDSIPAIFGLTQNTFLVFTATASSLMGLAAALLPVGGPARPAHLPCLRSCRDHGPDRSQLILHALHENTVPFINDGGPVAVVEISTGSSLSLIVGFLIVTVAASVMSPRGKAQTAVANARRHAKHYLDLDYEADQRLREQTYAKLQRETSATASTRPAATPTPTRSTPAT